MVADQWKKRLRAPSTVDYSQDSHVLKKKKKKHGLERYGLKLTSNISLVWNDKKKCVLPKKEQIGISRRDLAPFLGSLPHHHSILADVFTLPCEIFEFRDLSQLLSPKVWQANLSEDDRGFLAQFLPEGSERDEIVRKLLGEENFHFGNPFLEWGQRICSGSYHPDNVMCREQILKANKKEYYMELQNYHDNMIGTLQLWKENLECCKDSEEEMVERILRKGFMESAYGSSPDGAKVNARSRKGEKLNKRNIQHSDGARYMSYIKVSREHYERVKNSMKHNSNSIQPKCLSNVLGDMENLHVRPFEFYEEEERQKLHDHWMHLAIRDVATGFANWTKRRSQQLQVRRSLGEEMEQKLKVQIKGGGEKNSNEISAELTDIKETEQKKISDRIFAELAGVKEEEEEEEEEDDDEGEEEGEEEEEEEVERSSTRIIAELTDDIEAEEKKNSDGIFAELTNNKEIAEKRSADGVFEELTSDNKEAGEKKSCDWIFAEPAGDNKEAEEEKSSDGIFPNLTDVKEAEEKKRSDELLAELTDSEEAEVAFSMEFEVDQHKGGEKSDELIKTQMEREIVNNELPQQSEDGEDQEGGGSASSSREESPDSTGNTDSDDESLQIIQQEDEVSPTSLHNVDGPVDQGDPLTTTVDGWPAVSIAASYGCATAPTSLEYSSAEELSLVHHPRVSDEPAATLIDLEGIPTGKDAGRDMLPREPSDVSLYGSYPPQNRNEMFQPFFKVPDSSSYSHEKQALLNFQQSTNLLVEPVQYSGHFRQQQVHAHLPLELRHKGLNDLLLPNQNFQGNLYPDSFHRHELLNVGLQDWGVSSAPSQSHLSSGDLLSHNWFSVPSHAARGSWSTLEGVAGPSQSIGSINNSDQSLYSVFSQCNELHQNVPYDLSASRERFIPSRNYGETGVMGVATTSNSSLQPAKPISYMSSQESPGVLKPNGLGWPNMPAQNPGLHDPMGKPFSRSWNP